MEAQTEEIVRTFHLLKQELNLNKENEYGELKFEKVREGELQSLNYLEVFHYSAV